MKKSTLLMILGIGLMLASCKKNEVQTSDLASIQVTNTVINGSTLTLNSSALTVANNAATQFTVIAGQSLVNLYPATAPTAPYYNQTIPTNNGDYYSLFLAGASPSAVDAVLVKESYKNYADSLCGVRFINLSPNSNPISVNITGAANGSEVPTLAYKAYSVFKQYPALKANTSYAFQVRDATTGALITSTTLTTPRFHNVTIALRGLITAPGILTVNHY